MITYGSVCSGIEAATVAYHSVGWRAAWLAEIEPFPSKVLHHHYGAGRPINMPSPDEDGLSAKERSERRASIKAVSKLPPAAPGVAPNLGDFTLIAAMVRAGTVSAPDVLVGGTPCQAFSVAGMRNSLGDLRGQLSLSFVDLANAIDSARYIRGLPASVIKWENVPGVLSTKDNAFGCFLGALAGEDCELEPPRDSRGRRLSWPNAGCVFGPQRTIAWRILDAQYFGVAQRRRRVFVIASARKGFDPAEILFEFDGVRRDIAPSRESRQEVTGTISSRTTGGGGLGTDFELAGVLQPVAEYAPILARCVTAGEGKRQDYETCTIVGTLQSSGKAAGSATQQDAEAGMLIPVAYGGNNQSGPIEIATARNACGSGSGRLDFETETFLVQALPCIGFNARQDPDSWTDRTGPLDTDGGTQAVCFTSKDYGGVATVELAPTMRAMNHSESHSNGGGQLAVCFAENSRGEVRLEGGDGQRTGALSTGGGKAGQGQPVVCVTGDITHTLKAEEFDASEDGTGRGQPIVAALAFQERGREGGRNLEFNGDLAYTLMAPHGGGKANDRNILTPSMAVRRLTPRECERLQGFEDDYTLIPGPLKHVAPEKLDMDYIKYLMRGGVLSFEQCMNVAADGPRYKALGNSMCEKKMRWLAKRINKALELLQ